MSRIPTTSLPGFLENDTFPICGITIQSSCVWELHTCSSQHYASESPNYSSSFSAKLSLQCLSTQVKCETRGETWTPSNVMCEFQWLVVEMSTPERPHLGQFAGDTSVS